EGFFHRRGGRSRGHERTATRAGQRLEVVVHDVLADLPAHLLSDGNVETPVDPGVDPTPAALLRRFRERLVRSLKSRRRGREADVVRAEESRQRLGCGPALD